MGGPKTSSNKRWRPTGDQVMILRGLFRGGLTTPSGLQIQRITSQLKEFGKVETKNVFYWFQNHKAREKQKLAKKFQLQNNNNNNNNNNILYYFYLPTQYPSAVCPLFPPQAMSLEKPEILSSYFNGGSKEEDSSSMKVTWLKTEFDDPSHHEDRHQNHLGSLRTLELFPTTPSSSSSLSSVSIAN